jgi:hypothetical protein
MNIDSERVRMDGEVLRQQQELQRQVQEGLRIAAEQQRAVAEENRLVTAKEVSSTIATLTALLERMESVENLRRTFRHGSDPR